MLAEPTRLQRDVLRAMPYSPNTAQLHTDASVLPASRTRGRRGTTSVRATPPARSLVTYDMTRLQRLDTDTHYLVTLDGDRPRRPGEGHRDDGLRAPDLHPRVRRRAAPAARDRHRADRPSPAPTTAGASTRTAPAPASRRPSAWASRGPRPTGPRAVRRSHVVYETTIRHHAPPAVPARLHPRLAHAGWSTSTTLPAPRRARPVRGPRPPRRPRPDDPRERRRVPGHPGHRPRRRPGADAGQRPRARLRLQPDQRLLVPRPRTAGSPATSSRCTTPTATGTPTSCTPTSTASADGDKEMYVSPFHDVDGRYELAVPSPATRLTSSVTLHARRLAPAFAASPRPGTSVPAASAAAGRPRRTRRFGTASASRASGSGCAACRSSPAPPHPTGGSPVTHPDLRPDRHPTAGRACTSPRPVPRPGSPRRSRARSSRSPPPGSASPSSCPTGTTGASTSTAPRSAAPGRCPAIVLHRPDEFFAPARHDGLIGFGEAYMTGAWDAEDLGGLLTVLAGEMDDHGAEWLQKLRALYVARAPRIHRNTVPRHSRQHRAPLRPVQRPVRAPSSTRR